MRTITPLIALAVMTAVACSDGKTQSAGGNGEKPTGLAVDEKNFPDVAFRSAILATDAGEDGILTHEELTDFSLLDVSDKGVTSLAGIEHFPFLFFVNASRNPIQQIDLSKNSTLTELYCTDCPKLTSLTLGEQPRLEMLNCSRTNVDSLDVTQCPSLVSLYCYDTPIAGIDLSVCPALKAICCDPLLMQALDLTACLDVKFVDESGSEI